MRLFRMREFVHLGSADEVTSFRASSAKTRRGEKLIASLGLPCVIDVANDPFFGRTGRVMASSQRDRGLKFELLIPVASDENPTACLSFNYHQNHFGSLWGMHFAGGEVAHSACVGFGARADGAGAIPSPRHQGRRVARGCPSRAVGLKPCKPPAPSMDWIPQPMCVTGCMIPRATGPRPTATSIYWSREVLGQREHDPRAALAFTVAQDCEGDQFTFFQIPAADLALLYGVEILELAIFRSAGRARPRAAWRRTQPSAADRGRFLLSAGYRGITYRPQPQQNDHRRQRPGFGRPPARLLS